MAKFWNSDHSVWSLTKADKEGRARKFVDTDHLFSLPLPTTVHYSELTHFFNPKKLLSYKRIAQTQTLGCSFSAGDNDGIYWPYWAIF